MASGSGSSTADSQGSEPVESQGISQGTTQPSDGTTLGSTSTGGQGSSADEGSSSTGLELSPLVDRGLVVRYFIDEADDGQGVAALVDAASDPLLLPLEYSKDPSQPSFVAVDDNRGLEWTQSMSGGSARVPILGTKVRQRLDGSAQGTIELVLNAALEGPMDVNHRLCFIGSMEVLGRFALGISITEGFQMRLNNNTPQEWLADVTALPRTVVHLVFDSIQPLPEDRVRLYLDGVLAMPTMAIRLPIGETINLSDTDELVLGNRNTDDRSIAGVLYYAAIYDVALGRDEVAANVERLQVDDDGP